jgi:hypothetical protein
MNLLTKDMMPELLSVNEACITIYAHAPYLPTIFRIRYYLKLLKSKTIPTPKNIQSLKLQHCWPFVALENDKEFWRHTLEDWLYLQV